MNRRVDDKVFLLSAGEADTYFHSNKEEQCIPTAYAKTNGALGSDSSKSESACPRWLRSPGQYKHKRVEPSRPKSLIFPILGRCFRLARLFDAVTAKRGRFKTVPGSALLCLKIVEKAKTL